MNRLLCVLYWVSMSAIFAFIVLPLLVVVMASVSPAEGMTLNPSQWTLRWFASVFTDEWLEPFFLSLWIALLVAIVSGICGLLGAYAVVYEKVPGHATLMAFFMSPLAVPQIVKGVAIVLFLSSAGVYAALGTPGLIAAHIVLTLPYGVRMIATALQNFSRNLDAAAQVLGASKRQRIQRILLPLIKPGIFSGMTFSFVISFNNIPLSLFLVRPGQTTLPITIINYMEYSIDPVLSAVNVASLVFVLAVILVFERIGGFAGELHGGSR
jgi:putative spermidine/putrescine transport system permease protein